ncbi:Non-lysosomal glucosylceramidase [Caenorhabditis elegans]|uniref:Non-lysosomal glucosylceramidase n=1 Tax=Caenorhabditis elegans TaxID=6239 RepID=Q6EUT4_CAEEL|nr:Non-lysosomal glucosylceramidase [Caenorhabditis elegans]CAH04764.1 Non-lysosomal glucosylceramidase [Caenorhabditis elegans]|eukprot:NP_001021681.1 Non-lysosomal glucosylceramidase [Caenorhabditis elegans]
MRIGCCTSMRRRRSSTKASRKTTMGGAAELEDEWIPSETMSGAGWKARGDRKPKDKRVPFNRPTPYQIYEALPFVRRYFMYWMKHTFDKEKLFINTFQPLKHKPYYGVPCGGIGCGAIGRDFRGGFCKFSLRPGLVEHKVDVVAADQFILSVRENDRCIYQKVLSAADVQRPSGQLSTWDFKFPKKNVHYRGLFPRSWTTFRVPELELTVVIRQVSPVLPHNYEDTTYPVCLFLIDVENGGSASREYEISVAFTFRNGTGNRRWEREAECSGVKFETEEEGLKPTTTAQEKISGVSLYHTISSMPCTYGLATTHREHTTTTVCERFDPSRNGAALWNHLKQTGDVPSCEEECLINAREMAVAVCNRFTLPPNSTKTHDYALSWDMPKVHFGSVARSYHRRYTRFFEASEAGSAADSLCVRALRLKDKWESEIEAWQSPILNHKKLPDWYKSAIFNELYFITDGGTVWFEFDENWAEHETHLSHYTKDKMKEIGRFGYLESWEYRMVNTYDVHFYASFALAELWPELEITIQSEFTDQVYHSIEKPTRFHMEGDWANVKTASRVPHDLGNPADEPWIATNAYVMHDTGKWKDLNMKYVLTSWRDYVVLSNEHEDFLFHTWPAVRMIMLEALENWDQDGDGMIENFGKADQTYDAWQMEGVSAYCGSLWLASLRVAIEMAGLMKDDETQQLFRNTLEKAKKVFIDTLWTGTYFRFCERSRSRETVMADQLCGYWFLQSVSPELADELLPNHMVRSALDTIYRLNVCKFGNGRMGAVNGMKPSGVVDREYIQADEMWTGVTYAVASLLIQQGEVEKAFHTASGSYLTCFEETGLQYQTPEALYESKFYRAIGYMRPLSIWAMQWSLKKHCGMNTSEEKLPNLVKNEKVVPESEAAIQVQKQRILGDTSEDGSSLGYVSDYHDERSIPKIATLR